MTQDEREWRLPDEADLIRAEQTLDIWAGIFAEHGLDRDAADTLRLRTSILNFRCGISEERKG